MQRKVRQQLEKLITSKVQGIARKQLSRGKIEQIVFRRPLVLEYITAVQTILGTSKSIPQCYAIFLRTLRKSINKGDYHAITIERGNLVVTVHAKVAGYEESGRIRKAIQEAKKELMDFCMPTGVTAAQKRAIYNAADGHHGDIITSGRKTTLGGIKAYKGITDIMDKAGIPKREELDTIDAMVHDLATYSQGTEVSKIYDIGLNHLANWIEIQMGWDQTPQDVKFKKAIPESRQTGKKLQFNTNVVAVTSDIQIVFGLSPSGGNASYRKAMADWDAGKSGKLAATLNLEMARIIGEIKTAIKNWGLKNSYNLANLGGSPSPIDVAKTVVPRVVIGAMFRHATKADMRLKVNKALFSEAMGMSAQSVKSRVKVGTSVMNPTGGVAPKKATKSKSRVTQKAGSNPLALRNMLNQLLPVAVAKNMSSPALNYRTGRFANSVRVSNVTQGPRGGNTMIEASYMTNPYETFAPGGDKYTPQRNPEKLIKKSLREVAQGIIGSKFGVIIN
jgi:hypothetical protein